MASISPKIVEVAPGVRVAQGYDFADFGFVSTQSGVVAIDAGTAERRVHTALADAAVDAHDVSHVILTHAHFDHAGGISALAGQGTHVIAQAGFPSELQRQHTNVSRSAISPETEPGSAAAMRTPCPRR